MVYSVFQTELLKWKSEANNCEKALLDEPLQQGEPTVAGMSQPFVFPVPTRLCTARPSLNPVNIVDFFPITHDPGMAQNA